MRKTFLLFVLVSLTFASCNPLKIAHNEEQSVDWTKFKTISFFGWADASGENINELDKKRIEQSFASEFKKRGLEFVKSGADLTVSLYIHIQEGTNTVAYVNHYNMYGTNSYYFPTWAWGYGYSVVSYEAADYHKGTLVVDVFDNSTKKLIWQAVASRKKLSEDADKREKNTPKAIASMMKSFPKK